MLPKSSAEPLLVAAYNNYSDQELVGLLAGSDSCAFEQLYDRYWFMLYQSGFFILRDKDAVKDIIQDVFTWLWENRLSLNITCVKAYLKAAVRFKIANYIRSGNIRDSFFDAVSHLSPQSLSPAGDEIIDLKELQQVIHDSVLQLPEKCRKVYRLSKEEGLSNREIAQRLGISTKTVEAQMTIALKRLRVSLGFCLICMIILYSLC